MTRVTAALRSFARFWVDFVIGDDPTAAVVVVVGLGVAAVLAHAAQVPAWWVTPLAAGAALVLVLARATRTHR